MHFLLMSPDSSLQILILTCDLYNNILTYSLNMLLQCVLIIYIHYYLCQNLISQSVIAEA